MIKASDAVFKCLAGLTESRHVFMLPGGAAMHLVDSLAKAGSSYGFKCVCMLHEQAAAIAADAYAQCSGGLGLVLVTAGPGGTNALTGTAASWIDSTPVLVMSGQANTEGLIGVSGLRQMGVQEVDIAGMASPVAKEAGMLCVPGSVPAHVARLASIAMSGRKGPVWIDIPINVQGAIIEDFDLSPPKACDAGPLPYLEALRFLNALLRSRRPVILAGNGIRQSGACASFDRLARRLGVPVMTTWRAADMLEDGDPLFAGRPGAVAQRAANIAQQGSDLLLAIGARLDLCQTGFNRREFAPLADKHIVDIDGSELRKSAGLARHLVKCDAGKFIEALLMVSEGAAVPDFSKWLAFCQRLRRKHPVSPQQLPEGSGMDIYKFVELLSAGLPEGALVVPGSSGMCAEATMQAWKVKRGQRILNSPGLGAMGFGLPAAIGASLAAPGRRATAIVGDGGIQHNIQELATLRRLGLPVQVFVLDNNGYASIRNMQDSRFNGRHVACDAGSGLLLPDICAVAEAYGIPASRASTEDELKRAIAKGQEGDGPSLCSVKIFEGSQLAPRSRTEMLPDGSMSTAPMDDLHPPLEEGEMQKLREEMLGI